MQATDQLLTPDQVRQYRDDGYVVLGRVLSDAEIDELLAEERCFRPHQGYGADANRTLLVSMQLCNVSEPVRRICLGGAHLPKVVQLLGPDVCLTHNQFLAKLPDGEKTHSDIPMHQDNGYGRLEPPDDITVWIALTDTNLRNGCLHVVAGSHHGGLVDHGTADVNPALREAAAAGPAEPVELGPGEAIAFTGMTLHGSGPNRTDGTRVAFYVRYCAPSVRMMSEGGKPVLDDAHSWMVAGTAPHAGLPTAFSEPHTA